MSEGRTSWPVLKFSSKNGIVEGDRGRQLHQMVTSVSMRQRDRDGRRLVNCYNALRNVSDPDKLMGFIRRLSSINLNADNADRRVARLLSQIRKELTQEAKITG
jgi:hypothetical protein